MCAVVNPNTLRSRARRARMTSSERTAYHAKYAQKRRVDLLRVLTPEGRCDKCKDLFRHDLLEVDHVDGITWDHNELNQSQRSTMYWKEHKAGIPLRALCQPCNGSDGAKFKAARQGGA
jgi:hypothetical protein